MSVTFPRGFRAAGVTAGMKASGRPDLALLVGDRDCSAAGLFTTNAFAAAPVRLSRARLASGTARAVLVNSGQANAATGPRGERDALEATAAAADLLGIAPGSVLACSTGVIGESLHMEQLLTALPPLVAAASAQGGDAFAEGILTTDTKAKQAIAETATHRVGGAAKGVGMIAPDLQLATMLAFVTTDASVPPSHLGRLAAEALEPGFEALTVDGCTSTNDTVLLLSSGAAGGDPVVPGTAAWGSLAAACGEVGASLVEQLAHDAEGANHVLLIDVTGALDTEEASAAARAVADSLLVKTAVFGGDPNPGRILQAVGSSGASVIPGSVDAWIGDVQVIAAGTIPADMRGAGGERVRRALKERDVRVRVRLGDGPGASRALGVDLSYEYVRINAEYTT
ncbi:MAG TPA: bifunctional glutamate N-acetyltransferase/amino-acid acetyltransferase ArgJ [Actinomycetota bacterium]|nr:bifunctional glutamate N-acetyltransferase/amino-acid acetyltransferase ArgJ [Actinomycetota bacterium]